MSTSGVAPITSTTTTTASASAVTFSIISMVQNTLIPKNILFTYNTLCETTKAKSTVGNTWHKYYIIYHILFNQKGCKWHRKNQRPSIEFQVARKTLSYLLVIVFILLNCNRAATRAAAVSNTHTINIQHCAEPN